MVSPPERKIFKNTGGGGEEDRQNAEYLVGLRSYTLVIYLSLNYMIYSLGHNSPSLILKLGIALVPPPRVDTHPQAPTAPSSPLPAHQEAKWKTDEVQTRAPLPTRSI